MTGSVQKLIEGGSANTSQLSLLERDVLWEYAKLNDKIKRVSRIPSIVFAKGNELKRCRRYRS